MSTLKLTKNELREQQKRLHLFERYLPTLQLKKARLQVEVNRTSLENLQLKTEFKNRKNDLKEFASLAAQKGQVDILQFVEVSYVKKHYENVAGVEIPIFEEVLFKDFVYNLLDTPIWLDRSIDLIRLFVISKEKLLIGEEKKRALEKELKEVSIRVNLFEKILIPRSKQNIKKISVFLGDQQLAAVSQAKVAKLKIREKKR